MTGTDPLTAAAQELEAEAHMRAVRRFLEQAWAEYDDLGTPPGRRAEIRGFVTALLERTRSGIAALVIHARPTGEALLALPHPTHATEAE